jgi:uncharacterized protein
VKYLLLLIVVVAVLWLMRLGRSGSGQQERADASPAPAPKQGAAPRVQEIVACVHCGVHLPRNEALPGPGGLYCSEAHRQLHGRSPGEGPA